MTDDTLPPFLAAMPRRTRAASDAGAAPDTGDRDLTPEEMERTVQAAADAVKVYGRWIGSWGRALLQAIRERDAAREHYADALTQIHFHKKDLATAEADARRWQVVKRYSQPSTGNYGEPVFVFHTWGDPSDTIEGAVDRLILVEKEDGL